MDVIRPTSAQQDDICSKFSHLLFVNKTSHHSAIDRFTDAPYLNKFGNNPSSRENLVLLLDRRSLRPFVQVATRFGQKFYLQEQKGKLLADISHLDYP